jgi:hypothetical protein
MQVGQQHSPSARLVHLTGRYCARISDDVVSMQEPTPPVNIQDIVNKTLLQLSGVLHTVYECASFYLLLI